jgi:predicted double-glycine peptidase
MGTVRALSLAALLLSGAGRAAFAAAVLGPSLRLGPTIGAPAFGPAAPAFQLESYRGLALSLCAPGVVLPALPAPVPSVLPALAAPAPAPGMPGPSIPADYLPVPIMEQEQDYSCGAAAALAVLRYWQAYGGDERSLYELLGTSPKDGTPPENLARGLSWFGLESALRENMTLEDLRAALRRGDSVILDIQAWRDDEDTPWSERWDDGHYAVLAGMDEHYVYLMDPSTPERYTYLPLAELLERWHDYEDRDGSVRRYYQTGIIARGRRPLPRPSEPPLEPEPIKMTRGPRSLSR